MRAVMVILLLSMILKDTAPISDPNIFRVISQTLCLIVGVGWMLGNTSVALLGKYWPLFGYLLVSLISGLLSPRSGYALIQTGSLASVIIFSIAYFESQKTRAYDSSDTYFNVVIFAYSIICTISILFIKLNYSYVYGRIGEWSDLEAGIRFHGLLPISGMMAAASGCLVGYLIFRQGSWWWRWPALAAGLVCLLLTQSRTFWIATLISSMFLWWFYNPKTRAMLVIFTFSASFIFITLLFLGVKFDTSGLEKSARIGSVDNLTGRIPLWTHAMENISKRPIFGYGSTVGSFALHEFSEKIIIKSNRTDRSLGHETLHNGYLQTLLDLGILGLFFYVAIFIVSIRRALLGDKLKKYGAVIYGVLFMAIGNLGESIVYSAAVSHSIVFWCVAVFALYRFAPGSQEYDGIKVK